MHRYRIFLPSLLAAVLLVGGCNRTTSSEKPQSATTQAATTAPAKAPTTSVLTINGKPYEFRTARLILDAKDDGLLAQVFSEGASPEGAEDGYYIEMMLDVPDASKLDGASWQYTSASNERDDNVLSAITVNGGTNQLMPKDVTVSFREVSPDTVEVRILGFFNVFGGRTGGTATGSVPVEAVLVARKQGT